MHHSPKARNASYAHTSRHECTVHDAHVWVPVDPSKNLIPHPCTHMCSVPLPHMPLNTHTLRHKPENTSRHQSHSSAPTHVLLMYFTVLQQYAWSVPPTLLTGWRVQRAGWLRRWHWPGPELWQHHRPAPGPAMVQKYKNTRMMRGSSWPSIIITITTLGIEQCTRTLDSGPGRGCWFSS